MKHKKSLTKLRLINLLASIVAFGLTYVIASRGIFTGSWWEYGGTLVMLIIAINRLVRVFEPIKNK